MVELYPADALVTAARAAARPIAFLVGSPLSNDGTGGVPGVHSMLDLVREEIQLKAPNLLTQFEATIAGKSGANAYQTAISWLAGRLTQDAVNRVVRNAVLKARNRGSPPNFKLDGTASDWCIPAGTGQLAHLVVSQRDLFPGPILTTNFDPLIHLAISQAGGLPRLHVADMDGGFARRVETDPGATDIVHLHGYWRDADTLHTPAQLTSPRPRLVASLRRVLQQRTLLVLAYGGWDDVFAATLGQLLDDEDAQLNVLWCFHEIDADLIRARYDGLFKHVAPAIARGRFLGYLGVDCHLICTELENASSSRAVIGAAPSAQPDRMALHGAPPATAMLAANNQEARLPQGWDLVTDAYLDALAPLDEDETIRYYDGALPSWRHAISSAIPRRDKVADIVQSLSDDRLMERRGTFRLIRAAGGEGKSTMLLQVAAELVRTGNWSVLWRRQAHFGLDVVGMAELDPSKTWLILADDADNLVHQLKDTLAELRGRGQRDVHFLFASRDADWRAAHGDEQGLESSTTVRGATMLRGLSAIDAHSLVAAWERHGAAVLRALSNLPTTKARIAALQAAANNAERGGRRDGSFFGALLTVRFDEAGLRAHVREFMARLRHMDIPGSENSLFDALLFTAIVHSADIDGLDERILADLMAVPRYWVRSRVVQALGEEANAVQSGGYIFVRHWKVADAIVLEAEQAFGIDVGEVWTNIVRQTVRSGNDLIIGRFYASALHIAPRLLQSLPRLLSAERRSSIAEAAATAAVTYLPQRLSCVVDQGKVYRLSGDYATAAAIFRDAFETAPQKIDFVKTIRGYCREWGLCESMTGQGRDSALRGVIAEGCSLSDAWPKSPVQETQLKTSCSGLSIDFGKLTSGDPLNPYGLGRRAAAFLLAIDGQDIRHTEYARLNNDAEDQNRTPYPKDLDQALDWLRIGVSEAAREIEDKFFRKWIIPSWTSFDLLRQLLQKRKTAKTKGNPK